MLVKFRNQSKAYIYTNIIEELRSKILGSDQLMMIEMQNEDVVNSYMCQVTRVPEIPVEDTLSDTLHNMLEEVKEVYGEEGVPALAQKVWNI